MAVIESVDWNMCGEEGCIGSPLSIGGKCWAHANDQDLEAALKRLAEDGLLDGRGVSITAELLARILAAVPRDPKRPNSPMLQQSQFDRVTFGDGARFADVTFGNRAGFSGARFGDGTRFDGARFGDEAEFTGVTFGDGTRFADVTFGNRAGFTGARFGHRTRFSRASFGDDTRFVDATFGDQAGFPDVTFGAAVLFRNTNFGDQAGFAGARFGGEAWFDRARFGDGTRFAETTFGGDARFASATFGGEAWFVGARFGGEAGFARATFRGDASFAEAKFEGHTGFGGTIFEDSAAFNQATFKRNAGFGGATFQGVAWFGEATFKGEAWFAGATFERARTLGPMQASGQVMLDDAIFRQRVRVEIAAAQVTCRRTRFLEGGDLRLRWAQILLDDADFAAPSILSAARPFLNLDEQQFVTGWQQAPGPPRLDGQPWLASLRRADVAGLALGNVDLQVCYFADAHNLDRLRLESGKRFAATPEWKAVETGWAWPPLWWWTRRLVLAEEHQWRARYERGLRQAGWHHGETWPAASGHWVANPTLPLFSDVRGTRVRLVRLLAVRGVHARQRQEELRQRRDQAGEIANLYRALRKGHEDNKDEPGAADFYYGEMELRRKASPPSIERLILWLYWLVSGYGLRAWRAITATLVVLAVFAMLMVTAGFQHPARGQPGSLTTAPATTTRPAATIQASETSVAAAMIYGARTAIGLTRNPQPALTRWGDVLQIAVRIMVPVLLGLAVLSIRGRVRR